MQQRRRAVVAVGDSHVRYSRTGQYGNAMGGAKGWRRRQAGRPFLWRKVQVLGGGVDRHKTAGVEKACAKREDAGDRDATQRLQRRGWRMGVEGRTGRGSCGSTRRKGMQGQVGALKGNDRGRSSKSSSRRERETAALATQRLAEGEQIQGRRSAQRGKKDADARRREKAASELGGREPAVVFSSRGAKLSKESCFCLVSNNKVDELGRQSRVGNAKLPRRTATQRLRRYRTLQPLSRCSEHGLERAGEGWRRLKI